MTIRYVNESEPIAFYYMVTKPFVACIRVISIGEKVCFDLF